MPPPEESPTPRRAELPATIGRYRIIERVGSGAMGVVYSAYDNAMGRPVAVKVLMGDLESDPAVRARFHREARAAAGLLHPNIITIYDAGEDQGRSYIAMQLLEGWPLTAYMKLPEAASVERKLGLMIQICEGLAVAHRRGIVHRDLKPSNLFVQSDGLLKILDFGIARIADSNMTVTGSMLGTPDYMSPEQARGTQVDTRSDIFSAGAVFYFMLAGHKPFPGPDLAAILHQLQADDPAPLSEAAAPPDLSRLIRQAMAKNPGDRPARIQDLLAGILRFRRHFQADTRRLADKAAARYTAIVAARAELDRTAAALELSVPNDEPALLVRLRARFPTLLEHGGAELAATLDRARVTELLTELDTEQRRLNTELADRDRLLRTLREGERALRAGDAHAAAQQFELVRSQRPSSRRAQVLSRDAAVAARELDTRDVHVRELMVAVRRAFDVRDWQRVEECCAEVLALVPDLPEASSLRDDARRGLARERRRRSLMLQQVLDRAAEAIADGRVDEAEAALREAEPIDPTNAAIRELRGELAEARLAAAAAERLRQQAADEICRARGVFRRGRYDEAVVRLQEWAATHLVTDVTAEVERLGALRDRITRSEQLRRRQVVELMDAAQTLAESGALDEALGRAGEAVRCDPSDLEASALLDALLERDLVMRFERERARARDERRRHVEAMLEAAHDTYARGYISSALAIALAASQIDPDRPEIVQLIEELRAAVTTDDVETFDLEGEPFAAAPSEPPSAPEPPPESPPGSLDRPQDGGVLSHMNQWLLRGRPTSR